MTVLGHVVREGRIFRGESPEQVAGSIRIAGKTIRRIEDAETDRPRDLTLTTLATYYAMNADFFRWIAQQTLEGPELVEALRHRASLNGLPGEGEPLELALALARQRPVPRRTTEETELETLQAEIALLSGRRRQLVRQLVDELRLAQIGQTRQRAEDAA